MAARSRSRPSSLLIAIVYATRWLQDVVALEELAREEQEDTMWFAMGSVPSKQPSTTSNFAVLYLWDFGIR